MLYFVHAQGRMYICLWCVSFIELEITGTLPVAENLKLNVWGNRQALGEKHARSPGRDKEKFGCKLPKTFRNTSNL